MLKPSEKSLRLTSNSLSENPEGTLHARSPLSSSTQKENQIETQRATNQPSTTQFGDLDKVDDFPIGMGDLVIQSREFFPSPIPGSPFDQSPMGPEDPTWKVLLSALKKYNMDDDAWQSYVLFIWYGTTGKWKYFAGSSKPSQIPV